MNCYKPATPPFAGVADPNCKIFDANNLQGEQMVFDAAYNDLINGLGININYYVNTYNLSSADNLYGEQPTKRFSNPQTLRMFVEVNNNAIALQKFGFVSDDEFTGYVHITTFTNIFEPLSVHIPNGQRIEPKSGDVVELVDLGCRPGNRGPRFYEITERVDQDIPSINPVYGSYVYRLKGKRLEYSFEPGLSGESGNNQVFDNTFSGVVSSAIQEPSEPKSYPGNVDEESETKVYNQNINDTDIYGGYGY